MSDQPKIRIRIVSERSESVDLEARVFSDLLSGVLDFCEAGRNAAASSPDYKNAELSILTNAQIIKGSTIIDLFIANVSPAIATEVVKYLFSAGKTYLNTIKGRKHNVSLHTLAVPEKNRIVEEKRLEPFESRLLRQPKLERGFRKICVTVETQDVASVQVSLRGADEDEIVIEIDKKIAREINRNFEGKKRKKIKPPKAVEKTTSEAYITKANFDDTQMWHFRLSGRESFYAYIDDTDFWVRVHNQDESFYENQRCIITYYEGADKKCRITKIKLDAPRFDW